MKGTSRIAIVSGSELKSPLFKQALLFYAIKYMSPLVGQEVHYYLLLFRNSKKRC